MRLSGATAHIREHPLVSAYKVRAPDAVQYCPSNWQKLVYKASPSCVVLAFHAEQEVAPEQQLHHPAYGFMVA